MSGHDDLARWVREEARVRGLSASFVDDDDDLEAEMLSDSEMLHKVADRMEAAEAELARLTEATVSPDDWKDEDEVLRGFAAGDDPREALDRLGYIYASLDPAPNERRAVALEALRLADSQIARAEAAEAEVARLERERDEMQDVLGAEVGWDGATTAWERRALAAEAENADPLNRLEISGALRKEAEAEVARLRANQRTGRIIHGDAEDTSFPVVNDDQLRAMGLPTDADVADSTEDTAPPIEGGLIDQPMRREMGVDAPDFGPLLGSTEDTTA